MSDKAVKIYSINGVDWIAATSLEEAVAFWKTECGMDDEDADGACEVPESEMDIYRHLGDDGERAKWPKEMIPTFRQELASDLSCGQAVPYLFATTEY